MTIEEKLDLIWRECKDHVSYDTDEASINRWKKICSEVADNNTDINSPIFKMYLQHLRDDGYINNDEMPRATVKGLLFEGYVNQKNNKPIFGKYQSLTTWAIVLGGLGGAIAGVYYFLEIIDRFHTSHFCH